MPSSVIDLTARTRNAPLASRHLVLQAHGCVPGGVFTVPAGMTLAFLTELGTTAGCDAVDILLRHKNDVRRIVSGDASFRPFGVKQYIRVYTEGERVPEHVAIDDGKDLFGFFDLPLDRGLFFSVRTPSNRAAGQARAAWTPPPSMIVYTDVSSDHYLLSDLLRSLPRHRPGERLTIVVPFCRPPCISASTRVNLDALKRLEAKSTWPQRPAISHSYTRSSVLTGQGSGNADARWDDVGDRAMKNVRRDQVNPGRPGWAVHVSRRPVPVYSIASSSRTSNNSSSRSRSNSNSSWRPSKSPYSRAR